MSKGIFMIYIFLEDYTVKENATLLRVDRDNSWSISLDLCEGLRISLTFLFVFSPPKHNHQLLHLTAGGGLHLLPPSLSTHRATAACSPAGSLLVTGARLPRCGGATSSSQSWCRACVNGRFKRARAGSRRGRNLLPVLKVFVWFR
jgi:hypothetical protein